MLSHRRTISSRQRALVMSASAAAAALLAPAVAFADADSANTEAPSAVQGVTVTARKVEEDIQKVPVMVTAVSGAQLKQQSINNIYDLRTTAPSLTVNFFFTSLLPNFAIRGLSTGVTTYFSEAANGPAAVEPFMDISQVQVLNGPQGTLFGRSSAAGAVLITPVHPNLDAVGGLLDVTVGDYGRRQLTGVANFPLVQGELGLRIAASADHVDGYTRFIGTSRRLDEVNNQQVRVGLEFRKGRFDNYLVASYAHVNQSGAGNVLTAVNFTPADLGGPFSLYNLPGLLGPALGPAVFGGICAQSVSLGFSPDIATCQNQRAALLGAIKPAFQAELARLAAGGSSAIRSEPANVFYTPDFEKEKHYAVVDVAQYDFDLGSVKLNLKNIFSFDSFTDVFAGPLDGIGGRALLGIGDTTGPLDSVIGSANYLGARVTTRLSPPVLGYLNDFQVHANLSDGLLVGTVGVFYSDSEIPRDVAGTANVYKVFSGVFTPDLGFQSATPFSAGGYVSELAVYTQETLDLSRWAHGLSVTAGYRYSWDKQLFKTYEADHNYDFPAFTPGSPGTLAPGAPGSTGTSTSGYNYTFQVSEQVNPAWMLYASVNRAYVPGGTNHLIQTGANLPNYTPTIAPEIVLEEELGTKFTLNVRNLVGRFGADIYNNDFTNIVKSFYAFYHGASVGYNENIAAAYLRGVEVYGDIVAAQSWEIRFSYNYNQAHYTKWTASDPFNVAQPGDPECVPASPPGLCYLNLTNNPFNLTPSQQGNLTVVYHVPIDPELGGLELSATGYFQSRVYQFSAAPAREVALFPGDRKDVLKAVSQAPYATLNLRAEWQNAGNTGVNLALFVDNVTDTVYARSLAPQTQTLGFGVATYAPPRMFGFEISRKFGP
jgi:iron complex outermembrane receptor protein